MKKIFSIKKSMATLALLAVVASPIGLSLTQANIASAEVTTAKVTILKYIGSAPATGANAYNSDFQMNATYVINGGAGSGQYALSASGYNGDPTPYQAMTSDLPLGSDYGTNEIIDGGVVGAVCSTTSVPLFTLTGYTSGNTLAEAVAATPTTVAPNFTNITSDKFVIVWNHDCAIVPPPLGSVKVTINKYIDGLQATSVSANSADFPMNASWDATNIGAGSGQYALSASGFGGDPTPYQATTVSMDQGANYATNEITDGAVVAATCVATTQPFALSGYTSGNTLAEAVAGTHTTTSPSFTNLTTDKYVIVWNTKCAGTEGHIEGIVTGGAGAGVLAVTSVETVNGSGVANGTFASGWKYLFNVTIPTNETNLAMKFADWTSAVGSNTIAAANNMRISSTQADNSNATVLITAANTYSTPNLHMVTDLNSSLDGIQVKVLVETAIPLNTVNGSYSTAYGVKTQ